MNQRAKTTPIYGNWVVKHPDGRDMFRCSEKKANWYLSRSLGTMVAERTVQLSFVPAGNGHATEADSKYYLEPRENRCVVCGATAVKLNRHHIVPYQYRKHLPVEYKARASYDIQCICLRCHDEYEVHAQRFSQELAVEYQAFGAVSVLCSEHRLAKKGAAAAFALLQAKHAIPAERQAQLLAVIAEAKLHHGFDDVDLPTVNAKLKEASRPSLVKLSHAEQVISHLTDHKLIQAFTQRWRLHFIETMHPKFMSKHWFVDYDSRRDAEHGR